MSTTTDQPTTFLVLNTGMHTSIIRRVSADQRGRTLLTVSNDKTARLWDLATGTLLRTLRPPIGESNHGILYAGTLSRDGSRAAVSGWTSQDGLDNNIYIFDTATGQLLHRIGGLPNVIFDLEFSPDGRFLAAALFGKNGMRVYRTSDFGLQAQDTNYGDNIYNLSFDAWGRLATICYDGHLRLYAADFKLLKKTATPGGKRPYTVAFSPDGLRLAVGYDDASTVEVFDGTSLELLYAPDVTGTTDADKWFALAFSVDGSTLAAGGTYKLEEDGHWWRQIRSWADAGQGSYTDHPAAENSILDLKPLATGGFLFGGFQPDWGLIDPLAGQRGHYRQADIYVFNSKDRAHFRLGANGEEVGVTPFGKSPLRFNIKSRQLESAVSEQPGFVAERPHLVVTDWLNLQTPQLNGQPLTVLHEYEICRSVDIATGGAGVVLGADWHVFCTDAKGVLRWKQSMQSTVWCVKIDAYNQVVAAALGDGTIRWYRFHDGAHLLSLYLHPDQKRWVLWTPSGYFDCAPGAEELLGWHVNNGPDQAADYFPLSKFRQTYYRPDVIDLILETLDPAEAARRANTTTTRGNLDEGVAAGVLNQLPPVVRILRPTEGQEVHEPMIPVEYSIESPGSEVSLLRLLVDGRPISVEQGFKATGKALQAVIPVPAADCVVSVIAENRFGASVPATIRLRWKGDSPVPDPVVDIRPRLYVLAIGVSEYQHSGVSQLGLAAKDARDFTGVVGLQQGVLYQEVAVRLLTDAEATRDNILDALEWLQRETTARDVAMLYFAGHGLDDNSGNFYYLPVGADPAALKRTCISKGDIQSTVASVSGKILVFMDACHSGGLMHDIGRRGLPADVTSVINELISAENGAVVFSSATTRQYALENPAWGNGAFTKALVEGLSGQARTSGQQKITMKTLDAYVAERVKALTEGKQSPVTVYPPNVPDFPLAMTR